MTIALLPETTICLLGSTQAITTPTSLVKELIENALDAKATSVEIIISANTIDKIEVRDNGNGIPREDYNALGRRGYTSKLRTFDELKFIGGISLGFRGEALFSAAQVGKVSVSSKSGGEAVAAKAQLQPGGGTDSLISTSHPLGTTICVTELFGSVPVRKQTCLKDASKTMGKIKELLRAYSLARPHIKFSLKVNKGGKESWFYSPRRNGGIKETVSQVISRDLANLCIEESIVFSERTTSNMKIDSELESTSKKISLDNNFFFINMFLPKPTADSSKVSHGQYISVDGRPMSKDKGTIKRIITIFKLYVKSCYSRTGIRISNPFLQMNIKCPVDSYDPNIEPAKDDVLFINEQILLENIEKIFKDIYGEHQAAEKNAHGIKKISSENFDILLSRETPSTTSAELPSPMRKTCQLISCDSNPDCHDKELAEGVSPSRLEAERSDVQGISPTKKVDMSTDYNENVKTPVKSIVLFRDSAFTPESPKYRFIGNTLNPWVISKKNQSLKISEDFNGSSLQENRNFHQNLLLSPQLSSDPTAADLEVNKVEERSIGNSRITNSAGTSRISTPTIEDSSVQLISPCGSLLEKDIHTANIDSEPGLFVSPNTSLSSRRREFVSARQIIDSQQYPEIETNRSKRQKIGNKPFISPVKKNQKKQLVDPQQTLLTDIGSISRGQLHENGRNKESNPDLTWSMDYEHRKGEATKIFRDELRMSQKVHSSPHSNRYNAAALALDTNSCLDHLKVKKSTSYPKVDTSLSDDDPRGYYIRRQKFFLSLASKVGGPKISRAKSLRLPLERIPAEQQLHQYLMRFCTNMAEVKKMNESLRKIDQYITRGNQGLPMNCELVDSNSNVKESLIHIVKDLVEKKLKNDQIIPEIPVDEIEFKFNQCITL